MGLSQQIRQQLINSFKAEQKEHVQKINQGLLALEKKSAESERRALLEEIFREAHSLKGAARAVGMTTIESIGHSLEELLLMAKEGQLDFSAELFDLLFKSLDTIELLMERLEAGQSATPAKALALMAQLEATVEAASSQVRSPTALGPDPAGESERLADAAGVEAPAGPPEPDRVVEPDPPVQPEPIELNPEPPVNPDRLEPASPTPLPPAADETIRVSVSKLDTLMAQFSELVGAKIRAEQRLAEVRGLQAFAADWQKHWLGLRASYSRLMRQNQNGHAAELPKEVEALIEFTGFNQERLRAFGAQSNLLYRELANDTMRLSLMIDELQEEIKRVRMLPLTYITAAFGRMVRDLAREQAKCIDFVTQGAETELDKRVLEQIKDPLIHLLRNAIDHGIELPDARLKANKPATGKITLAAIQQGSNIVITISDDGRGMDLEAIRQSAVRKGLFSKSEADKLTETELVNLIFNSGFSTTEIITDISGRGVGMDVVRQNVEELHGTLEVSFKQGQGTTFTMTLPLTLASSRGLLVCAGDQMFVLPLTSVERMIEIKADTIARVKGQEAITYQGQPVGLAWLADLLDLPRREPAKGAKLTIVIITLAEKRLGLIVDELAGEQEIVVKSLGRQLVKVGGFTGATVLGTGEVILVLHPADLIKLAGRRKVRPTTLLRNNTARQTPNRQRQTILVVDDSITTRTLEKNILEAAGYEVKLATNGEEALGMLMSEGLPHLVVSDVNMPRLDGFGLTQRIKQDSRCADLPVVLVTSLDSPADKARGIEVGADAYIVKSHFDQGDLLEIVEQLI